MKLASFDIFDTALIRRCGKPENIFYLMAERLWPNDSVAQERFVEWRKKRPTEIVSHRKYVSHGMHGEHGTNSFESWRKIFSPTDNTDFLDSFFSFSSIRSRLRRNRSTDSTDNKAEAFFAIRLKTVGSPALRNEVMLEEIYSQQSTVNGQQLVEELVELEKEIERENLMVNPRILEVIEQKRAEGWQIAFISDMYLDAEFLREVLRREGCFCDGDLIYVSCECGARKDLGTMYDFVRQELKPTEWKHWGDNRRSDVEMAHSKGVMPMWVDTIYTEAERGGTLCGYQRATRIALGGDAFVTMAADFVAPAYVPYILWVLGQRSTDVSHGGFLSLTEPTEPTELTNAARVEGKLACIMPCKEEEDEVNDADATPAILSPTDNTDSKDFLPSGFDDSLFLASLKKRSTDDTDFDPLRVARPPKSGGQYAGQQTTVRKLYFLSRDSYVLMKGAEVLKEFYPNVDLRYLFVSRRSLFLPYLACDVSAVQMLSVMDKRSLYGKSVDELLSLLATDREELRGMAIEFAYKKIENRAIESDFLDKIFGGDYLPLLRERAEEAKRVLLKYFEQEGLLSGNRCEMVDVGWLGTTRLMINRILDSEGAPRVKFYYYGVRGDVFGEECGEYETYFQAGELSTMATALVENYFSASPYSTTVGYDFRRGFDGVQGTVVPLFPEGKEYSETEITKANRDAVALLVKWVYEAGFSDEQLRCWAEEQLNKIIDLTVGIDLLPLAVASEFDKTSFVRKMSGKELMRFVCVGANITAFDKASLALTVEYKFMPCLWWLHSVSGRVRRFLYLKFKHNR